MKPSLYIALGALGLAAARSTDADLYEILAAAGIPRLQAEFSNSDVSEVTVLRTNSTKPEIIASFSWTRRHYSVDEDRSDEDVSVVSWMVQGQRGSFGRRLMITDEARLSALICSRAHRQLIRDDADKLRSSGTLVVRQDSSGGTSHVHEMSVDNVYSYISAWTNLLHALSEREWRLFDSIVPQ